MLIIIGALILVLTFTTRNVPENFVCGYDYEGRMGLSPLTMVTTTDEASGLDVERNAFWLLGLKDDFYTMQQIKRSACEDATIPVIVFFMHPSQGLALEVEAIHYMSKERIGTWEEYDEKLDYYAEELADIPSIIVMEPSLLMHTFYWEDDYKNTEYQLAFSTRVEKVIQKFKQSWVYVDAGNAMYLQWTENLEHIINALKKMPATLRGFSINVGSFVNSTFNRQLADEIHCQTGLHYVIDTSRNGGEFSTRSIEEINECTYDPPMTEKGVAPSWQSGAAIQQYQAHRLANSDSLPSPDTSRAGNTEVVDTDEAPDYSFGGIFGNSKRRRKRWNLPGDETEGSGPIYEAGNPAAGGSRGSDSGGGDYYNAYGDFDVKLVSCVSPPDQEGLDAFVWVKTPGESDGRMYPAGTFHQCLLGHLIECTDTCPQYVPKLNGVFQRSDSCRCIDA